MPEHGKTHAGDNSAEPSHDARVVTFGCRLNAYESEVIRDHLTAVGNRDMVVINSCAVTAEAERQLRQTVRRLRRQRPGAEIIVTGCAAQIDPQRYAALPEVDRVLGNAEKLRRDSYRRPYDQADKDDPGRRGRLSYREQGSPLAPIHVGALTDMRDADLWPVGGSGGGAFPGRARAFLQMQQGCDHRCTFCVIPFGRGPSRSTAFGQIVEQARQLVAAGHREIVMTGVDLCSYGRDLPGQPNLGSIIGRFLKLVPALPRLRLSSVDPAAIDDDLKNLIAEEPRLMPHLHLSLQAGDDLILKRMKRRHNRRQTIDLCQELRHLRPEIVFGADLIAGFPTENEMMFANTLALIDELGLTHLHVFPYSPRPGTPAARMPPVDVATARRRAARLRDAGARQLKTYLHGLVGRPVSVLVERRGFGREAGFAPVSVPPGIAVGTVVSLIGQHVAENPAVKTRESKGPSGPCLIAGMPDHEESHEQA